MEEPSTFPNRFQRITMWRALTGLAILVLGALLVFLIWLLSTVLGYLQPVFVPLAVAGIIAYLLDPVVRYLQTKGLTRIKGIAIVFTGFLLFFGALFYFVGNKLSHQIKTFVEDRGYDSELVADAVSTPEGIQKIKSDKFWGWIVTKAFEKDRKAVSAHLETGGTLMGLNGQKWHLPRGENVLQLVKHTSKISQKAPTPPIPGTTANPDQSPADSSQQQADTEASSNQANQEKASTKDKNDPIPDEQIRELLESDWSTQFSLGNYGHAENVIATKNFTYTKLGVRLRTFAQNLLIWLSSSSGKVLGFLGLPLGLIMIPIYLYYFLKESNSIQATWHDYVPLKASQFKTEVVETLSEINGYLISFFRGQVLVAFIDGILVGITLTIFGLPYGLLIGVVMAMLGIIPYIGNIICLIPACIIAYFHGATHPWGLPQWGYVLGVVAIFVIVQQINSLVTAPKIVGDSVGLHPMTVIFSMLFWALILGGFLGALLAVPLTAAVKVLFRRYVWEKQGMEKVLTDSSSSPLST